MSRVLRRASYSPNIKERADFSCAIFDSEGRLMAQAEAIPVHLGSMGFVAKPVINKFQGKWSEGDAIIVNSPRSEFGGTHLPDITLLSPIFVEEKLAYVVANRAHHADVGGMAPGSLPADSVEVFQEGLIIPPIRLFKKGRVNLDVLELILENVRTPDERKGDLNAQYASLSLGTRRLKSVLGTSSFSEIVQINTNILDYSESATKKILKTLPKGSGTFEDTLDNDGFSQSPVKIRCYANLTDQGELLFDFTGSDSEQLSNCNAPLSITTSCAYYATRLLTGPSVPTNEGCFRSVKVIAPENSILNPSKNAATSSANTETSQRIVDVILGALSQWIPLIPAASQGTMNNVILGGIYKEENWTIYETLGGGAGANFENEGTSAIQCHMTNTENTPIEALETQYPLIIREYRIREGSGGLGEKVGGDGLIRTYEFVDKTTVSLQTERRVSNPYGIKGGKPGEKGENILLQKGKKGEKLRGKTSCRMESGDMLIIKTPGGGGYGSLTKQPLL